MTPTSLIVGGLAPLSTCDWPGQLSAVIFAQGCSWNCSYCHNPHLLGAGEGVVPWDDVITFLKARTGLLDGVVFSGGEPTIQAALGRAMREVRELGFAIGLHTGGPITSRFTDVLPLVDWVGFDVKAPFADYERITGVPGSGAAALTSLRALVASGVEFETRTTVHPDLLTSDDLERMSIELSAEGVTRWVAQSYRTEGARPGLRPTRITEEFVPASASARFAEYSFRPA